MRAREVALEVLKNREPALAQLALGGGENRDVDRRIARPAHRGLLWQHDRLVLAPPCCGPSTGWRCLMRCRRSRWVVPHYVRVCDRNDTPVLDAGRRL
jgi:hypothetical protein